MRLTKCVRQFAALSRQPYVSHAAWLHVEADAVQLLLVSCTFAGRWWQRIIAVRHALVNPQRDTSAVSPCRHLLPNLHAPALHVVTRAVTSFSLSVLLPPTAKAEGRLLDLKVIVCTALQGHQHRVGLSPGQGLHAVAGCQHVAARAGAHAAQAAGSGGSCRRRAAATTAAATV